MAVPLAVNYWPVLPTRTAVLWRIQHVVKRMKAQLKSGDILAIYCQVLGYICFQQ